MRGQNKSRFFLFNCKDYILFNENFKLGYCTRKSKHIQSVNLCESQITQFFYL